MITGRVHFIAIGGSVMHNLAIALKNSGCIVSGSDDKIYNPSRDRLVANDLLPEKEGWFPEKITNDIDYVILGMHAKKDNLELIKAQNIGCKIYSYPELIYEISKNKTRVVIGGSHGKTTVTSMILHVLNSHNNAIDYLLGASIEGFDNMVSISDSSDFILIEGDEYLSSPIDLTPKFHKYKANIAVITGIAWDHINVFPNFENYILQFEKFIESIVDGGVLVYNEEDDILKKLVLESTKPIRKIAYSKCNHFNIDGITYLESDEGEIPIKIFGKHNLSNLGAAQKICSLLGIFENDFFNSISEFKGASKRLELIYRDNYKSIFKDFAHSPSKLHASLNAVKNQFSNKQIIALYELHTFSSFHSEFIKEYNGCMDSADIKVVYYDIEVLQKRSKTIISRELIQNSFNDNEIIVLNNKKDLSDFIRDINSKNYVLLLMSSGSFSSVDFLSLINK